MSSQKKSKKKKHNKSKQTQKIAQVNSAKAVDAKLQTAVEESKAVDAKPQAVMEESKTEPDVNQPVSKQEKTGSETINDKSDNDGCSAKVSKEKSQVITCEKKLPTVVKVIAAIAIVAFCYFILWRFVANSSLYNYLKAGIYKFNKDYVNAVSIYDELGDYRLSEEKSHKLHHILGEEYLVNQDYVNAMEEFKLSGDEDNEYYSYALGMYCFVNGSYETAIEQLNGTELYDSKDKVMESRYYLAIDSIRNCDKDTAYELLDGMKLDYAPGDFTVGKLKRIISMNEKYMDYAGTWAIDSGIVGAYEAAEEGCTGWEYDISAAGDTQIELEVSFDDSLNASAVLNVTYPYYAAYSRNSNVQSMFTSYKTVTKRLSKDDSFDQIVFDDNTNILFVENGGVFRYHDEGAQLLPEEESEEQVYAVRETTMLFSISQH